MYFFKVDMKAGKDIPHHGNASFTPDYSAIQPLFKKAKTIYRYTGSLTTPPCLVNFSN
jgi:carbonic anhydrase